MNKCIPVAVICLLFFANPVHAVKWGKFKKDACVDWGKRKYSSILWDIPWGKSWENTCRQTGANINGKRYAKPYRCVNTGANMWGEFIADDASCKPHWGKFKDDGCVSLSALEKRRQYSAILWGIPPRYSWEAACAKMTATIKNKKHKNPTICIKSNASTAVGLAGIVVSTAAGFAVAGPVGSAIASAGTSTAFLVLDEATGGFPLNMWGVYYVEDKSCQ